MLPDFAGRTAFRLGFPRLWGTLPPPSALWDLWGPVPGSPWMACLEEPYLHHVGRRKTHNTKFTGKLRTKSIQFKADTPPMLAPELLGSHHPNVHRLHEEKSTDMIAQPEAYSTYIKYQLNVCFKACKEAR